MISANNLKSLFYDLKTLCSNNSACQFCPLSCVCGNSTHPLYSIEYDDIDELVNLVEENEQWEVFRMISGKSLRVIMYGLKQLCNSKSECVFCPLDSICINDALVCNIEHNDIDKLADLIEEHEWEM